MLQVIYLVLLTNVLHIITAKIPVEAYYWREYTGVIPKDALQGGVDEHRRPIYIGQVLFEDKLIPGKIYTNDKHIYFHWGSERKLEHNVKILCTKSPEDFEWLRTKHDELTSLTNKHLVKGGFQPNLYTYIGRAYVVGETTIGKVMCELARCLALYVTNDGKAAEYKDAFEVLSYNPKNKRIRNVNPPIDIRVGN